VHEQDADSTYQQTWEALQYHSDHLADDRLSHSASVIARKRANRVDPYLERNLDVATAPHEKVRRGYKNGCPDGRPVWAVTVVGLAEVVVVRDIDEAD
jgi:hypothetical protein